MGDLAKDIFTGATKIVAGSVSLAKKAATAIDNTYTEIKHAVISNNANSNVGTKGAHMINLSKGQKISLDKSVKYALVGLGWDVNKYDGQQDFDLDASVFLLGDNDKLQKDEDFIFYNNLRSRNDAVIHSGDNRTGDGVGDDEVIKIDFSKVPADVKKMAVVVTIHEAAERKQNFGQVSNAYIHLAKLSNMNDTSGEDQLRFDLGEDFSVETAIIVAEIYRKDNDWKFSAVASGYQGGLASIVKSFGGNV